MKDGITHLGLQFWNPSEEGGIELVGRFREKIDDETIGDFREWGKRHGVRVMLCVFNGTSSGWDWDSAQSAFAAGRAKLVEALVGETLRLGLDGVDIDFEGKGTQEESRESFIRFIKDLSSRLHEEGRELTVDTFAYKWNAPNQSWWPALLPHVDGLHVMGYSATGAGAADWRSYESLKTAAGEHAPKLLIGMPGHEAEWLGGSVRKHLQWVADDAAVGLAIWDARLKDAAWRSRETWQTIAEIRATGRDAAQEQVVPDFSRGLPGARLERKEKLDGQENFHLKTALSSTDFFSALSEFLGAGWGKRRLDREEMIFAANKGRTSKAEINLAVYANPEIPGTDLRVIHLRDKEGDSQSSVEILVIREEDE